MISKSLGIPPGSILENMSLSIFILAYALGVSVNTSLLSPFIDSRLAFNLGPSFRTLWTTTDPTNI